MSPLAIYPWQNELWQQLMAEPDKLPHALLLAGPAGLGKQAFALAMAARLLCEAPGAAGSKTLDAQEAGAQQAGLACGECSSCHWLLSGNHPDFRLVQPGSGEAVEEAGGAEDAGGSSSASSATRTRKTKKATAATTASAAPGRAVKTGNIRIEQIRELADFVFIGSHRHGRRIVIVQPAEAMNPAAANALLKILEEPPAPVCFILISDAWRRLLPTILSRCRVVTFGRPQAAQAVAWLQDESVKEADNLLQLVGGAPLLARDWAQQGLLSSYQQALEPLLQASNNPVDMAAKWAALLKNNQLDMPQLVDIVQKWLADLLQLKLAGGLRYHRQPGWQKALQGLAQGSSTTALLACDKDLRRIRAVARHPLNTQLFLEDMAARYLRAVSIK